MLLLVLVGTAISRRGYEVVGHGRVDPRRLLRTKAQLVHDGLRREGQKTRARRIGKKVAVSVRLYASKQSNERRVSWKS